MLGSMLNSLVNNQTSLLKVRSQESGVRRKDFHSMLVCVVHGESCTFLNNRKVGTAEQ
jgi:hypothetical protein